MLSRRLGRLLANLRLTAALLAALFVLLVLEALEVRGLGWPRAVVLAGLAVNLSVGVWRRRQTMARRPALLAFHLCLISALVLATAGWAVSFQDAVGLAEGQAARLRDRPSAERGPFTPAWLAKLAISLAALDTRYFWGDRTESTRARLEIFQGERLAHTGAAEPTEPAEWRGVHVYLTQNQGFAAQFSFRRPGRRAERGVLHFPEYRALPESQVETMNIPGLARPLTCQLQLADPPYRADTPWRLEAPAGAQVRVVDEQGTLGTLAVGQRLTLRGGVLRLERLARYARLVVSYNPFASSVTGLGILAALCLSWHLLFPARRPRRRT